MKVKFSLNADALKQGLADHIEKVLFGLVVICFLGFLYRAIGREGISFGPEELQADAQRVKETVANAPAQKQEVSNYHSRAKQMRDPIKLPHVAWRNEWDPAVIPRPKLRTAPELFPLLKLQGSAGQGAFAMWDPDAEEDADDAKKTRKRRTPPGVRAGMPGEEMMMGGPGMAGNARMLKGQRWIVVTGLFDWKKQVDAYKQTFKDTFQNQRHPADYPQYLLYEIQRAEVDPLQPDADPLWKTIDLNAAFGATQLWQGGGMGLQPGGEGPTMAGGGRSSEVAPEHLPDPGFVNFAFPLGPLQNRSWGPEIAHLPEIPLADPSTLRDGMMGPGGSEMMGPGGPGMPFRTKSSAKGDKADKKGGKTRPAFIPNMGIPQKIDASTLGQFGGGMGGMEGQPGSEMGGGMGGRGPYGGMGRSGYGRGPGGPYGGRMPGMPGMPGSEMGPGMEGTEGMEYEEYEEPEYKLFRFFDFNVAYGKHYRYRVRLTMLNPNFEANPQHLREPSHTKLASLETNWCEPSPVIRVPLESQVLALSAKPSDSSATVMIVRFDPKNGDVAFSEFPAVQRGQLLNFRDREVAAPASAGRMGMGMGMGMGMEMGPGGEDVRGGPNPYGRTAAAAPKQKVNFLTECLYLDSSGGGNLPGRTDPKLTEPANILLLDHEGKLMVRNELDDFTEVQLHKPATPVASGYGTGVPPGYGPPPGPGGKKGGKRSGPPMMGPPGGPGSEEGYLSDPRAKRPRRQGS